MCVVLFFIGVSVGKWKSIFVFLIRLLVSIFGIWAKGGEIYNFPLFSCFVFDGFSLVSKSWPIDTYRALRTTGWLYKQVTQTGDEFLPSNRIIGLPLTRVIRRACCSDPAQKRISQPSTSISFSSFHPLTICHRNDHRLHLEWWPICPHKE